MVKITKELTPARLVIKFVLAIPIMIVLLFWPAGTILWSEGWIYLIIQFTFSGTMVIYFFKRDPKLLESRMSFNWPTRWWDKIIAILFLPAMTGLIVIPGLDAVRYAWSSVPILLEAIGFIGVVISLYIVFLTMKENPYCSKIVEIQKQREHKVITTGPYEYVRHPMYAGVIILFFSLPIALGSLYGLIPGVLSTIILVFRTYLEDKTLHRELEGYTEYAMKTHY